MEAELLFVLIFGAFFAVWVVLVEKEEPAWQRAIYGSLFGIGFAVVMLLMSQAGCDPGPDPGWQL